MREGLATQSQQWGVSSWSNFALDRATVADCPIQVCYVRLPEGYQA